MKQKPTTATKLQQRIDAQISLMKAMEEHSPSVIIVHLLAPSLTVIYMSKRGLDFLKVTLEELMAMGPEYHPRFFNLEFAKNYAPRIIGLIERNNNDEIVSYVQQVRASEKDDWTWFLSCTKVFMRDDDGNPLLLITNAIPLDAQLYIDSAKAKRLMDENNFLHKNHQAYHSLTKREKEILRMMALGTSSVKMAKRLHISDKTANTHRRNIKKKLKVESNYDIIRFAQAFDLV